MSVFHFLLNPVYVLLIGGLVWAIYEYTKNPERGEDDQSDDDDGGIPDRDEGPTIPLPPGVCLPREKSESANRE